LVLEWLEEHRRGSERNGRPPLRAVRADAPLQ